MKPVPELVARQRALEFVRLKYRGRVCDFRPGGADCIRMVKTLCVKRGRKSPPVPRYSSQAGALRALKQAGFANLTELFDSFLERIPPARMLPGDIAVVHDELGVGAAVILFPGAVMLGWHQHAAEAVFIAIPRVDIAWRV